MRSLAKQFVVLICLSAVFSTQPPRLFGQEQPTKRKDGHPAPTAAKGDHAASTASLSYQAIVDDLGDWRVWLVLALAFGFGCLGSLAYGLVDGEGPKTPPPPAVPPVPAASPAPKSSFGFRVLLGGLAAVAVLFFLRPDTLISLIGLSIMVGSMGTALFHTLQSRVEQAVKTAQLSAALTANLSVFQEIEQQSQEGATLAMAAEQDRGGAVTLSVIAGLAKAGHQSSAMALRAQENPRPVLRVPEGEPR